jgi:hypothetical protein
MATMHASGHLPPALAATSPMMCQAKSFLLFSNLWSFSMPFMGIGLHVIIAIFFAIHAVRHGRELYWLLILFMFPLFGSLVYFFAVYLPDSRLQYQVRRTVSVAAKSLDPGRNLREARAAFELTPTAQNQIRLANALLESGATDEAIQQFEACLQGPFARDPEIRLSAARARFGHGDFQHTIDYLTQIRNDTPQYLPDQVALLLARAYAAIGDQPGARREFEFCNERYGSIEAKVEYAIWALNNHDTAAAEAIRADIDRSMKHWTRHTYSLNQPLIDKMNSAFSKAGKS